MCARCEAFRSCALQRYVHHAVAKVQDLVCVWTVQGTTESQLHEQTHRDRLHTREAYPEQYAPKTLRDVLAKPCHDSEIEQNVRLAMHSEQLPP